MTFVEELRHVLRCHPVTDALDVPHPNAAPEYWEAFYASRRPTPCDPVDHMGEEVRVLTIEEAAPEITHLMREQGVFESELWKEIWRHAQGGAVQPVDEEAQVLLHLQLKCPNPEDRAVWMVYRDGKPAHARVFDRLPYDRQEVWLQWIVGVHAIGKPSLRVYQALYDVGVRRICWKTLQAHTLNEYLGKDQYATRVVPPQPNTTGFKHYENGLLHGRYIEYSLTMDTRPDESWFNSRRG